MVTFLFWTATKTNYISKCSDFQKKLIDTITTSNFYLKFKENNENDMAAQVFWAVFYSIQQPSQISPTADFDGAAIPPPIISMATSIEGTVATLECKPRCTRTSAFLCSFFWKVNHATPKSINMERKHSFLHLQVISILLENLTAGHCRPANT